MESTGISWIPAFEILEARGFEALLVNLVNARDVKNVPGRKTDVNDAQGLQQLHRFGLLRGSFRPHERVARRRAILRHRERLVESAATHIQLITHIQLMQKALLQMKVQLQHAVSDVTGVTGMRVIRAIVDGVHDPAALAQHRDVRCKESIDTIREALTGNYRRQHLFALRHALEIYDFLQTKIAECDAEIESVLRALNTDRPAPECPMPPVRHTRGKVRASSASTCGARSTRCSGPT
jgi:transposase